MAKAFDLESILEVPADNMPIITLTGDPGIGKTTLAAKFPNPVFIQVEKGMDAIPEEERPKAFPRVLSAVNNASVAKNDFTNIHRQLAAILHGDHSFKTLVIDSVTALAAMIQREIIEEGKKENPQYSSIELVKGGYGKGYIIMAERMAEIHAMCQRIRDERNMTIVFIAHSETEKIDPPDSEPYTKRTLNMHKKARQLFISDVDLVAYMTIEMYTLGDTKDKVKKAISNGSRKLICETSASNDTKNRYSIKGDIPVPEGTNPLLDYIPVLMQYSTTEVTAENAE